MQKTLLALTLTSVLMTFVTLDALQTAMSQPVRVECPSSNKVTKARDAHSP